jgi:hypothetical protein
MCVNTNPNDAMRQEANRIGVELFLILRTWEEAAGY